MSIKFVAGNLLKYEGLDAICHGCNCRGVMGAGVAAEIRNKFPKMYDFYKKLCKCGEFELGYIFPAYSSHSEEVKNNGYKAIYNLATQENPGADARLDAIEDSVGTMIQDAEFHGITSIGVPRLGAGIGGLKWEDVREILVKLGENTKVELVVFEKFVP
jgi:O-acetyl-ADP-ribose deacetylase (regulator of RNase III)